MPVIMSIIRSSEKPTTTATITSECAIIIISSKKHKKKGSKLCGVLLPSRAPARSITLLPYQVDATVERVPTGCQKAMKCALKCE